MHTTPRPVTDRDKAGYAGPAEVIHHPHRGMMAR
jgi:hypothetical protein